MVVATETHRGAGRGTAGGDDRDARTLRLSLISLYLSRLFSNKFVSTIRPSRDALRDGCRRQSSRSRARASRTLARRRPPTDAAIRHESRRRQPSTRRLTTKMTMVVRYRLTSSLSFTCRVRHRKRHEQRLEPTCIVRRSRRQRRTRRAPPNASPSSNRSSRAAKSNRSVIDATIFVRLSIGTEITSGERGGGACCRRGQCTVSLVTHRFALNQKWILNDECSTMINNHQQRTNERTDAHGGDGGDAGEQAAAAAQRGALTAARAQADSLAHARDALQV